MRFFGDHGALEGVDSIIAAEQGGPPGLPPNASPPIESWGAGKSGTRFLTVRKE